METYTAVLEATARILETRGLEAANTNAIADLAGISVGSLYQYFPNKAAIFAELVRKAERETAEALEIIVARTADRPFDERLRHLVRAGVAQQMVQPNLARIMDALETEMPDDTELKSYEDRLLALISQFLGEHREAGIGPVNKTTARDVLSIVKGMVDGASFAGETDAKDLERRVQRAILGYLRSC